MISAPLRVALALVCCLAPAAAQAQGGAFRVDDAAVGDPGASQLETLAGASLNRSRERVFSARLGHTLALFPALQLSLGVERDGSARGEETERGKRRFWGTTLAPEAKLRLLDLDGHGRLGLAAKAGLGWRSSLHRARAEDDDEAAPFRRLETVFGLGIATIRLTETVTVNVNGGIERDRIDRRTAPLWGVGTAWRAVADSPIGSTTLIAEVSGSDRGRSAVQAGLRQTLFEERLDLDLVLGRNLSDERATWLVGAIAVRF